MFDFFSPPMEWDHTGTSGDDVLTGNGASSGDLDEFRVEQGGNDTIHGGAGFNNIYMGASFTTEDVIFADSGALFLDGEYRKLSLTEDNYHGPQYFHLAAGHRYDIAMHLEPGTTARVIASGVAHIDASGEQNAVFSIDVSTQGCSFLGSNGDDEVTYYEGAVGKRDHMVGGEGNDGVAMLFPTDVKISGRMMSGFEVLSAGHGTAHIKLTDDGVVDAGKVLRIVGATSTGHTFFFDGHKEKDGSFDITGSTSTTNTAVGGAGNDVFKSIGTVTGGGGADVISQAYSIHYNSVGDSSVKAPDLVTLVNSATSHTTLDLHRIDANKAADGDQPFHLVSSFSGNAGELVMSYNAATDRTAVLGDVNGDAKADFEILMVGDQHTYDYFVL